MARWRSRVSHGAIVRSGRISKLASEPSKPSLGQSAWFRPEVALDVAQRQADELGRGKTLPADLPGRGRRRAGPSGRRPPGRCRGSGPGGGRAKSSTTPAPHDWPTRTGRSKPERGDQRRAGPPRSWRSRSRRPACRSGRGRGGRPPPRDARPRQAARATPSQSRAFDARPWTSRKGTPSPAGAGPAIVPTLRAALPTPELPSQRSTRRLRPSASRDAFVHGFDVGLLDCPCHGAMLAASGRSAHPAGRPIPCAKLPGAASARHPRRNCHPLPGKDPAYVQSSQRTHGRSLQLSRTSRSGSRVAIACGIVATAALVSACSLFSNPPAPTPTEPGRHAQRRSQRDPDGGPAHSRHPPTPSRPSS